MHIMLNGRMHALPTPVTVAQLLQQIGYGERRVAVEINREIVPRSQHASHVVHEGDHVELVQAMGGG